MTSDEDRGTNKNTLMLSIFEDPIKILNFYYKVESEGVLILIVTAKPFL